MSERAGNKAYVIGVGMTKFEKPGAREWDYPEMALEAGSKALEDAGVPYDRIEQAFVGYCYGESTSGQRAVYALGFEKMEKGSLGVKYTDRTNPIDRHLMSMFEIREPEQSPFAPQMFGNAGREHMERYGSEPDHFAWIGWKNHKHSVNNPYAQFQDEYTLEDIKSAKMIHAPLTKLQCSPTSDGSACAVVASERFVEDHGLWETAIEIAGQAMTTDLPSTFDEQSS